MNPEQKKARTSSEVYANLQRLLEKKGRSQDSLSTSQQILEDESDLRAPVLKLHPVPSKPHQIQIFVEGQPQVILAATTLGELNIQDGMRWTDILAEDAREYAQRDQYYWMAEKWLLRKMLSKQKLRAKLIEKECSETIAAMVIDKCIRTRLVDDKALGQSVISSMNRKHAGEMKIVSKLKDKGIDAKQAQTLMMSHGPSPKDQKSSAEQFARRRIASDLKKKDHLDQFNSGSDSDTYELRHKLKAGVARHLSVKGFSHDVVMSILDQFEDLLAEEIELISEVDFQ